MANLLGQVKNLITKDLQEKFSVVYLHPICWVFGVAVSLGGR